MKAVEVYEVCFPCAIRGIPVELAAAPSASYFCFACPCESPARAVGRCLLSRTGTAPATGTGSPGAVVTAGGGFFVNLCARHHDEELRHRAAHRRTVTALAVVAVPLVWVLLAAVWEWFGALQWHWQGAVMLLPAVLILAVRQSMVSTWQGSRRIRERVQFDLVPVPFPIDYSRLVLRYSEKAVALLVALHALRGLESWRDDPNSFTARLFNRLDQFTSVRGQLVSLTDYITDLRQKVALWSADPAAREAAERLAAFTAPDHES